MAKIEDLIAQIADERLRKGVAAEVKALKKTKKFGLVFEEHLPETVRLPLLPIRVGDLVAEKSERGNQPWRVQTLKKNAVICERVVEDSGVQKTIEKEFATSDIVVVRSFGDPIYPAIVPVDRVERGGPEKPWHLLINADNFHALQLLLYCYEGKVDVIYIDPPYNTGARDWKYNNDYVDKNDAFRHSKWLSMVKKRLTLAKRLLKPSGVLVVTIDEHEVHHLGALLEEQLPDHARQMVTIVINEKGVAQGRLSRVEEYAFFCFGPDAEIPPQNDDLLAPDRKGSRGTEPRWERLLRGGTNSRRADRKQLFFPIFVDPSVPKITGFGDPLPLDKNPKLDRKDEKRIAWPFRTDGSLGNWRVSPNTLRDYLKKGYVKLGGYDADRKTWTILYLGKKAQTQIESGAIEISGRDKATGAVSIKFTGGEQRQIKTVWHRGAHDSGNYGSSMLRAILGEGGLFAFPKSLYAVRDTLKIVSSNKPDALIVDFFGGSGTTLHATALLNSEIGGNRQCILVTNNEVTERNEKALAEKGVFPGDPEFERVGVAESVAWPRCKSSITGRREDGTLLEGDYLDGRRMQEGFEENVEFFRVAFLDPDDVARGDALSAIMPILWMMAGAYGKREDSKGSQAWFFPKQSPFAVLHKEKEFKEFSKILEERRDIQWVFLVTDSEENFGVMRRHLGHELRCVQLYKNYLENFRINTSGELGQRGMA